ncbi:hypothetical protein CLV51_1021195 [Chitinophaga niastensis]|uniref:Uncharacterized protein n=1 Tax=Chitinophaga niastensis TaxID=536980 RepID=A0A2P8HQ36_CHINA|nr:hypothetical protein CLV51_1021195 [Chitinophaga niastensis]
MASLKNVKQSYPDIDISLITKDMAILVIKGNNHVFYNFRAGYTTL